VSNVKPLLIQIKEIEPGEELKYYSSIVEKVISHFNLPNIASHQVTYGHIFEEYYWKKEALDTTLQTIDKKKFFVGTPDFIKPDNPAISFHKNLPFVIEVFNKYFLEEKLDKKFVIYEAGQDLEVHQLNIAEEVDDERLLKTDNSDFFSPAFDRQTILNTIKKYADKEFFWRLSNEAIEQGKNLAISANPAYLQDVLWQFEHLIVDCCPRESGENYEGVLNSFMKATHGELKISDFEKEMLDDYRCSISFKINDQEFETSEPLPRLFSLGSIHQINAFLSEEFGRSFYLWEWERNPWEQKTFIYLKNSTYDKYLSSMEAKEVHILDDYIVNFYDENR